ncbi:amine oxidase (copper-containing) (plasmid) [Rhodococcus jostii RHA1]|jgi:primary-amine oxidase|uniref:Amine oxidase n=2 Tax=Rhodococcus TaxID=1827 RepID=Q0RYW6_RHOJR|nr:MULTISPECIES: primary-amine oxidase [Rhodococcus]ABG99520.1 amine oxidase (copper-containing) [Rhodococcus jostii RHA1]EID81218.1 tyramine oxidase [Rhodococcus opacus RKJ300 = JCM 13270]QQZ19057.1 primary-amine oxidase [Rhodococcus sp. 21391]
MSIQEIDRTVAAPGTHPLDPLSRDEISKAVSVLKSTQALADSFRFVQVELKEPSKKALRGDLSQIRREASAVLIDRSTGYGYEATVDLENESLERWVELPSGAQPPIMLDEFEECEVNCKRDPRVVEALASRGLTNLDLVCIEPWSAGYFGKDDQGRRLMRALVFTRLDPDDSPYAHPAEGLIIIYDLNNGEVVEIEDNGLIPVPQQTGNYLPQHVGPARTDIKPLEITSPQGRSFHVEGQHVTWGGWSFRVGFTPREGLVLHQLKFRDGGTDRSVINRASLVEMVVPYGDPSPVQHKKNAFDAGEYNIGALANSLALGCDCLGEIQYFDGIVSDSHGNPMTIKNAVCMHEEDDSIMWKHYDYRQDTAEVRRSRKLIISFIATVANYEYGFYWHLYLDGTIEFLVKATGILSTAGQQPGTKSLYGQTLNNDGLYAPIHQHIFNVRMDFELDGTKNAVYEVDTEVPDTNPTQSCFYTVDRLLEREQDAARRADAGKHRFWKIVNHDRRNIVDEPVAYRLQPTDAITLSATPDSWVAKRAGFATNNFWVTAYDETERFPAGEYPNQSRGGDGLPSYIAGNRNIVDEDIVVWYTFGMHHVVRLEDWPVMPRQHVGFILQPHGFFDQNPTLNLPRPERQAEGSHCGCED